MDMQHAIVVKDARKQYGKGTPILNGLNVTVSRGTIYGLLGASGCGKTTLLSCVVGTRKLDDGEIWVLGGHPGSKGSGIPGSRVGYMPQEMALAQEFSVLGSFYYFGRINGLEDEVIEERFAFLHDLLQLPPKSRLIKTMSGGQQRRVSFGVALLHAPELLILDEPTVGLDPVLRDNIWNHLVKLTKEEGVTVVITTHYIEEAKQSDRVGLMKSGKLLAESTPRQLLDQYQSDSLEDVFLTLCQLEVAGQVSGITNAPTFSPEFNDSTTLLDINQNNCPQKKYNEMPKSLVAKKCKALFIKNATQFLRHPGGILFAMLLPIVQVCIFFNAIGPDPKGLTIAIVNDEAGNCDLGRNRGNVTYDENEYMCRFDDLSCRFLREFNESIAKKVYYDDLPEAQRAIKTDKNVGVMYFGRNFSVALQNQLEDMLAVSEEHMVVGQIQVWLDMGDRQIGLYVKKKLYDQFFEIYEGIMKDCRISPKYANIPIHFEDPIFGKKNVTYTAFVAPPFILTLVFFLATSVCSVIIIADRHGGVWDRSLVQGVTTTEILVTHVITQLVVIFIQVAGTLCLSFLHYGLECKGSMLLVIWLVFLEATCGMAYGLLISVMCTNQTLANYITTGTFYPMVLLCGCIWPVEGMPKWLMWCSFLLPVTIPGISMRGLLEKGTSVDDPEIYSGFLVVIGWTSCFMIMCVFGLRLLKS